MVANSFPDRLSIGRADFECLFITDTNIRQELSTTKEQLSGLDIFQSVEFYRKDPVFFNKIFDDDPLALILREDAQVEGITVPPERITDLKNSRYYEEAIDDGRLNLFEGVSFEEVAYLFPNGALVYKYTFHVDTELTTDEIIFLINTVVKATPKIETTSGPVDVSSQHLRIARKLSDETGSVPYTYDFYRYSTILVHRFGDRIERYVEDDPAKRAEIYDKYRSEIHSLSVRTIEDWQERFPPDADFPDKNIATSSVGFLRVNFRNTIAYEHPYSEKTVRNLYSYGIMELLSWNFLANVYLMRIGRLIDELSQQEVAFDEIMSIEEERYEILEALDDFHNYVTTPSFRARNFYTQAIQILGIDHTTEVLQNEVENLESVVNNQHVAMERREEKQLIENQTMALEGINKVLEAEEANSIILTLLQIFLAGSIAFNISDIFDLGSKQTLSLFVALVVIPLIIYVFVKRKEDV